MSTLLCIGQEDVDDGSSIRPGFQRKVEIEEVAPLLPLKERSEFVPSSSSS